MENQIPQTAETAGATAPAAPPEDAPEQAPAAALAPPPAEVKPRRRGFWEWLTRRHALRDARSGLREGSAPHVRELVRRGRAASELADRVFDSYEPLRSGRGKNFAAELYRESIYWSLSALAASEARSPSFAELWRCALSDDKLKLPSQSETRDELERLFVDGDFRTFAEMSEGDQQRLADELRSLAHSALYVSEPTEHTVRELKFQRLLRLGSFLVLLGVLTGVSIYSVRALSTPVNLAAGKPWKASSIWAECNTMLHTCGTMKTDIFFHTKEDTSPWVEFDLGAPTTFSKVFVKNRTDGAADRAIPLIVEVSPDAKKWKQVARRDAAFSEWTAEFAPQQARYVRLRVDRRTYFHLEAVEIRP